MMIMIVMNAAMNIIIMIIAIRIIMMMIINMMKMMFNPFTIIFSVTKIFVGILIVIISYWHHRQIRKTFYVHVTWHFLIHNPRLQKER